jgi:hypothetical protein
MGDVMRRWEYTLIVPGAQSDRCFDDLGQVGWELVGFDKDGNAWFKRPAEKNVEP